MADDARTEDVGKQLTAAALSYVGARRLTLDDDASSALQGLVGTAVEALAQEDKLQDEDAIGQVSTNLERLVTTIDESRPVRRGRAKPPVSGHAVGRALEDLCPGFWPFC